MQSIDTTERKLLESYGIITHCPKCGHEVDSCDANFCTMGACGLDLRPYKRSMPCCGKTLLLPDVYRYCPFCGERVNFPFDPFNPPTGITPEPPINPKLGISDPPHSENRAE